MHSLASEAEACKQIWSGQAYHLRVHVQAYHLCMHVQHFIHGKINIHITKYNSLHNPVFSCAAEDTWYIRFKGLH